MLNKFRRYNTAAGLIDPGDAIICAVSGGADSMALLGCLLAVSLLARRVYVDAFRLLARKRCSSQLLAVLSALASAADCVLRMTSQTRTDVMPYAAVSCMALTFALWGAVREGQGYFDTFRSAAVDDEPPYLVTETDRGACKQRGAVPGFYTTALRDNGVTVWQSILLPVVLTALYSFFSPGEIKAFMQTRGSFDAKSLMEIKLSPNMFSLSQYYKILIEDMTILRYFVNSAMYTAAILFGQALLIPAMAYALSRFRFRGRDALFFVVIMLMLLPFQVTMVPNVITLRAMGLLDTIWAIILPMTVAPFYIFLLRQYMVGLPGDMIEAAQIDGAGTLRCFIHVVLPVCQPILGAAVALSFADCWNLVEQPLTYLTTHTELYPLSVVFNQLTQQSTGVEFAGAALYTLPALLIYLYFQNDILEGVQLTELK